MEARDRYSAVQHTINRQQSTCKVGHITSNENEATTIVM
jgi:hypothetical protein